MRGSGVFDLWHVAAVNFSVIFFSPVKKTPRPGIE